MGNTGAGDRDLPSPRRSGRPTWRRSSAAVGAAESVPRVADLSALLADIDALRTTLSTDLTLAAAALEAGADDLAGELVTGDLRELHAFQARALDHLSCLGEPPVAEVPAPRRRHMMPAAPLVAAAAAVIGLFVGVVPHSSTAPPAGTPANGLRQAGFSVAWLSELVAKGATPDELRKAAQSMNNELADLVAEAGTNPAAAQQALLLLQAGTQVLSEQGDQDVLREALVRTRELERQLRKVMPPISRRIPPTPVRPGLPAVQRPDTRTTPTAEPERAARPDANTPPSPSAAASPRPSSSPSPAVPSPAPSTSPAPGPSPSPSKDPLPRPPGLPGN